LKYWTFNNQSDATKFALNFSKENDIVNSGEWANLIPEDAVRGWTTGALHSEETKRKLRKPKKKYTAERSKQQSERQTGNKKSEESKRKNSVSQRERYIKTPARSGKLLYDKDGVSKWFYEIPIDLGWILRQRRK
jgi:septum formation inhibitor MinC